jgi:hypothetical protein
MSSVHNDGKNLGRGLRAVDQLSALVSIVFLTFAAISITAIIFYILKRLAVPELVAIVLAILVGLWIETLFIRGTILYWKDKHPNQNSNSKSAN